VERIKQFQAKNGGVGAPAHGRVQPAANEQKPNSTGTPEKAGMLQIGAHVQASRGLRLKPKLAPQ